MTKAKRCLRRVVEVVTQSGRRVHWKLECGHDISKRASVPTPVRTRCRACEEEGRGDDATERA